MTSVFGSVNKSDMSNDKENELNTEDDEDNEDEDEGDNDADEDDLKATSKAIAINGRIGGRRKGLFVASSAAPASTSKANKLSPNSTPIPIPAMATAAGSGNIKDVEGKT